MKPLLLSLAHSLWQGAVLWVSVSAALRLLPARAANARYALGAGALALTVMAWVVTWAWLAREPLVVSVTPSLSAAGEEIPNNKIQIPRKSQITNSKSQNSDSASAVAVWNLKFGAWDFLGICDLKFVIFTFWLLGVSVGFWRMASSLSAARKVSGSAAAVAEPLWLAEFSRLRETLTVSGQIALRSSAKILSPCVAGLWRPVILIPASLLTNTPPEMLRAILAHELAHIRRRDWLVNLFQLAAEALLFFNPFVWLLSHSVRREREACCDLIASAACAGPAAYSDALLWCARRNNNAPLTLTAAPAFAADGQRLRDRVARVLFPAQIPKGRAHWPAALAIALAVAAVFAALTVSVRATVNKLTDSERVAAVVQAARDQGEPYFFSGTPPVTVSGSLVAEDGRNFTTQPTHCAIAVKSSSNRQGYAIINQTSFANVFSLTVRAGEIKVAAWMNGSAPTHSETFYPAPGQTELKNLTLPVKSGFPGEIRFLDEQGRAVAGVNVKLEYLSDGFRFCYPDELTSDSDGRVVFRNVDDTASYEIEYYKPGFQWNITGEQQFFPDKPMTVTLAPALTVSGSVTDRATGQPLAGVKIRAVGAEFRTWHPGILLAVSNQQGAAAINILDLQKDYLLELSADGYQSVELCHLPGQNNFIVAMDQSTATSGANPPDSGTGQTAVIKVTTPNSGPVPEGTLTVKYSWPAKLRGLSKLSDMNWSEKIPLRDGEARLTLPVPNKLTVSGGKLAGYYVEEQTFDLGEPQATPPVLTVSAKPAGAIHGKTFDADGQLYRPAEQCIIYSPPEKNGEWVVKTFGNSDTPALGAGHFLIPSLPLNVSYRILLQDQCNFTLSKPLTLTDHQPVQQVELHRKQGVDFTGKIVTAGGQLPKNFYFEFFPNNSRGGRNRVIPDVNFDIDGNYQLNFDNQFWIKINRRSPQPLTVRLP